MEEAITKDEIIGSLTKQVKKLEDKCDQANRSMRSTLVFKGVNGNEPNWTKTTEELYWLESSVKLRMISHSQKLIVGLIGPIECQVMRIITQNQETLLQK